MSRNTDVSADSGERPRSPRVDREAWAAEVRTLIATEADGNLTRFARLVGVDRKTVGRWLTMTHDVSEESVRQVARKLDLPVGVLLVRVGVLEPGDLPAEAPAPSRTELREDAEAVKVIETSSAQPHIKRKLFAHLRDARKQHERQRLADIQRMLGLLAGGRR